jgi:adenylyltransferase/sulfurtransferase
LNPFVNIISHTTPLLPSTAIDQLRPYNLVLDCTDRPQTRYLVNDAAVRLGIPLVSGAAIEWAGQWCILGGWHQAGTPSISDPPGRTEWDEKKTEGRTRRPCYRCLFPQPLPRANSQAGTCEEEGVFGPIVGVVGVQMAAEAIKVILGVDGESDSLDS